MILHAGRFEASPGEPSSVSCRLNRQKSHRSTGSLRCSARLILDRVQYICVWAVLWGANLNFQGQTSFENWGQFDDATDGSILSQAFGLVPGASMFVNNGQFSKSAGQGVTRIFTSFTNAGSLNLGGRQLEVIEGFTQSASGSITVGNGGRLTLSSDGETWLSGTVTVSADAPHPRLVAGETLLSAGVCNLILAGSRMQPATTAFQLVKKHATLSLAILTRRENLAKRPKATPSSGTTA